MKLVVDANIMIAAVMRDSTTRKLFFDPRLSLFAPEVLRAEVLKNIETNEEILARVKLPISELRSIFSLLCNRITFVPTELHEHLFPDALKVAPHKEDAPYIALALHLQFPLWSHDCGIAKQKLVKVVDTKQIVYLLGV